jgi:hypothetical protein
MLETGSSEDLLGRMMNQGTRCIAISGRDEAGAMQTEDKPMNSRGTMSGDRRFAFTSDNFLSSSRNAQLLPDRGRSPDAARKRLPTDGIRIVDRLIVGGRAPVGPDLSCGELSPMGSKSRPAILNRSGCAINAAYGASRSVRRLNLAPSKCLSESGAVRDLPRLWSCNQGGFHK